MWVWNGEVDIAREVSVVGRVFFVVRVVVFPIPVKTGAKKNGKPIVLSYCMQEQRTVRTPARTSGFADLFSSTTSLLTMV